MATFGRLPLPLLMMIIIIPCCFGQQQQQDPSLTVNACQVCECRPSVDGSRYAVKCTTTTTNSKTLPDLERITWPSSDVMAIDVAFEGVGLTAVQALSESPSVETISFTNNQIRTIWPSAFAGLKHLKYLSLSYNALTGITPDMFANAVELEELDLSHNELTDFNYLDFEALVALKTLNLNENRLKQVPYKALNKLTSLEYLYVSGNEIIYLDFGGDASAQQAEFIKKLKVLDLSRNKLALIVKETFQQTDQLQELDLSHNIIEEVDENIFIQCTSLKKLDLSFNRIISLNNFPSNVEVINLRHNKFTTWPVFPQGLKSLDVSENQFYNLFDENELSFEALQHLNISSNQLKSFYFLKPLSNLKMLDISNNHFKTVPKFISSSDLPALEHLYMNDNPLETLSFENEVALKTFSANNLNTLKSIKRSELKVKGRPNVGDDERTDDEEASSCVDIFISHCENLDEIEEGSFTDIPLCYLDLGYNNLSSLSEHAANWPSIKQGVNLQGNPWNCKCHLQWILDTLLDFFYEKQPSLLHELRCQSPRYFRGLRFVHWYKHSEKAFCDESKIRMAADYSLSESVLEDESMSGNDIIVIVLFVAIIVGVIAAAALIVYLIKGKYKHDQHVMKLMARKRQTMTDAKIMNGQSAALNRV